MKQNLTCIDCGDDFYIETPNVCIHCNPQFKQIVALRDRLKQLVEEKNSKFDKRIELKRFSYHVMLYVPLCLIIGMTMGVEAEMLWILGGLHLMIVPTLRDWLTRVF